MKWPSVSLGEVASLERRSLAPEQIESGTSYLGLEHIQSGGRIIEYQSVESGELKSNKFMFDPETLLYGKLRPYLAKVCIPDREGCCSTDIIPIRPGKRLDIGYLRHLLLWKPYVDKAASLCSGANLPRISPSTLLGIEIPLPPLEEQRRIAAILDKASALEQLAFKQQLATEEAEAHLFLDCLGSPFPRLTKWPVARLCDLGLLERGISKHRPRNDPSLMNGPYPFIQTGDVAGCHRVIESFNATYSEKGLAQSRLWQEGTLCITIAANIAKTGILGFEACFPDSVVGFQSDKPALITYVQCWMGFLQKNIEKMAPKSAQKNINLEILRELQIPLPHEQLLRAYHEHVLLLRGLWTKQRLRCERIAEMNYALSLQLLGGS